MQIRLFKPEDTQQIAELFHNTVRQVNIRDYSLEQIIAWSPDDIYFQNWLEMCSGKFTYVADCDLQVLGFAQLETNGHIDCFYVHYQHQNRGVGSKLYQAVETKAKELNLTRLFAEVSITAKPFFINRGFKLIASQQVSCRGEQFVNYLMEKKFAIEPLLVPKQQSLP